MSVLELNPVSPHWEMSPLVHAPYCPAVSAHLPNEALTCSDCLKGVEGVVASRWEQIRLQSKMPYPSALLQLFSPCLSSHVLPL